MNKKESKLCECGCGEYAKPGNRFINGHQHRGEIYWKSKQEPKLCECGCGDYAKPGNRFITGHNQRGVKLSGEHVKKIQIALLGRKVSNETRKKNRIAALGNKNSLGCKHTDEANEKNRIAHLGNKNSSGCKHTDEAKTKNRIAHLGRKASDKTRKKMGVAQNKRFEDPEQRILHSCRMLGITRDDWDGFGSVYCDLWCEELREHIRDKYGRVCFLCGKTEKENGQKHDVHHTDYNKDCGCDGTECRLVPLCKSCHGKTTAGDRKMWEKLIMDMLEKGE